MSSHECSRRWPVWGAGAVFLGLVGTVCAAALRQNDGHFVYAQDDPYIHLALARTLAASGVWGLAPGQFAPASSSPVWTVLLALLAKVGATAAWWPFALNVAAGVLVIWTFDRAIRPAVPAVPRFAVLVVAILVLPLVTLTFVGMEHSLHIAVVIALCTAVSRRLAAEQRDGIWPAGMGLATLAGGVRYEGLFVVAVVVVGCLLRRARKAGLSLAFAGAVVPLLYGGYAILHGAPLLPNSVLMKSAPWRFGSWTAATAILGDWVGVLSLYQRPPLAALTIAALLLAAGMATPGQRTWRSPTVMIGLFFGTAFLHVCLVKMEWFFRYEAYVVALGLVSVTLGAAEVVRVHGATAMLGDTPLRRRALIACAGVLLLPLANRAAHGLLVTVPATGEVYRQQYQMGLFFGEHYGGEAVALNDIGAVSWLAPVTVVDLVGLASPEVADARRKGEDDTLFFDDLLRRRRAKAACVYDFYFNGQRALPDSWQRVGEWSIGQYVAVSRETVAFYAPSGAEALRLRLALDEFSARLPSGVEYRPSR